MLNSDITPDSDRRNNRDILPENLLFLHENNFMSLVFVLLVANTLATYDLPYKPFLSVVATGILFLITSARSALFIFNGLPLASIRVMYSLLMLFTWGASLNFMIYSVLTGDRTVFAPAGLVYYLHRQK